MMWFKKKAAKVSKQPECLPITLVTTFGYSVKPETVISMTDRMIVRVIVQLPFSDDESLIVKAKKKSGEDVTMSSILMGKLEREAGASNTSVTKEFLFSVAVQYPEQDLIFEIFHAEESESIHQELVSKQELFTLRAKQDEILYKNAENDASYTEWLTNKHRATDYQLEAQRNIKLRYEPLFSIVVPLYQTPINFFNELIACVKSQSYSNWELILVNASSNDAELRSAVALTCEKEERIKSIELEKNEGITLNTAYGIDAAQGDFICFLDHDDVIEPNCLFEYAQAINEKPDVDLLYCDEDLLLPDGSYDCAFFKPDFNLYLLRAKNYVCHMLTIRADLLRQLEFNCSKYDGAQDHHLTLQASEKARRIEHVAKVLYHWRVSETSVAGGGGEKPYATEAGIRAVQNHLDRTGVLAHVVTHESLIHTTKIEYELPAPASKVSIIVPLSGKNSNLSSFVEALTKGTSYLNFEVIFVGTSVALQGVDLSNKLLLCAIDETFNFARYVNCGFKNSTGDYFVLLNENTSPITPDWIENMLRICAQKHVGAVGCKLLFPDETLFHAGIFIGDKPYSSFQNTPSSVSTYKDFAILVRETTSVSASCMMFDRDVFDEVGGFNEDLISDLSGIDFCFNVSKVNKKIVYTPYSQMRYKAVPPLKCCCLQSDAEIATKDLGVLQSKWPEKFAEPDPNQNKNVAQNWRGAYYSLHE